MRRLFMINLVSLIGTNYHTSSLLSTENPHAKISSMHQGEWLKLRVAKTGRSNAQFARDVNMSREALQRYFLLPELRMQSAYMWRILDALGLAKIVAELGHVRSQEPPDAPDSPARILSDIYHASSVFGELVRLDKLGRLNVAGARSRRRSYMDGSHVNVDPYSEESVPEIPMFELSVAAGGWVEIDGEGQVYDGRQIDHGRFRIRVRGESMSPAYKDGMVVEFRCLRQMMDGLEVGKDYYVQRRDGTATFKRLSEIGDYELTLVPLNRRKFKDPLTVLRSDVVRMAKAVFAGDFVG